MTDHRVVLLEFEKNGLGELRTKIHDIVSNINDLEVFIYIDDGDTPIVVQNGECYNKLVIRFDANGIDYRWVEKTLVNKSKDFFRDLAVKVASTARDVIIESARGIFQKAITFN